MGGVFRIAKNILSGPTQYQQPAAVAPVQVAVAPEVLAPEVEGTSEAARLLKNKKRGSGSTLLTGWEGSLGNAKTSSKSLLGN